MTAQLIERAKVVSGHIAPNSLRDAPALIERIWPAQKVSVEAQKERKAVHGQTLTSLGSYWKGRKPLILVKACILGALLPATDDQEADLALFEKLMAIDDAAFLRRGLNPSCLSIATRLLQRGEITGAQVERLFILLRRKKSERGAVWEREAINIREIEVLSQARDVRLDWNESVAASERKDWAIRWIRSFDYQERVDAAQRAEDVNENDLFGPIWDEVNRKLGTSATSLPDLTEQLGVMRFGHRPRVADAFCGAGSIPFEAARIGCDAYASDLNPLACMLTWGAVNIVGAKDEVRKEIELSQQHLESAVAEKLAALGLEHDSAGNRAKAFLYCLETRCPKTGWMVPLIPSRVISAKRKVVASLVPNRANRRFDIDILTGVTEAELHAAARGTVQDGTMVYELDGEIYRTPIKTIRGDYRLPDGSAGNRLRHWEKHEFAPRPDDVFQERLYCIQWITKDTIDQHRQETFFASVTSEDLERERTVAEIVGQNIVDWQAHGLVPDAPIEPGKENEGPIRTNGWCYWHQMFMPRALLTAAMLGEQPRSTWFPFLLAKYLDNNSKSCRWAVAQSGGDGGAKSTFDTHALKTIFNWTFRSFAVAPWQLEIPRGSPVVGRCDVACHPADQSPELPELVITDPPYADAIRYEEITEFFIAWLRRDPPAPFARWVWDSRRALAIKGDADDFRRGMVAAYKAMTDRMPENGLQIVMFTHQSSAVWADMAQIFWASGLQVMAAWYIATETTSELKKGGYVQGTVVLVLRKRGNPESGYRDEIVHEVKAEVARQIETLVGLNQTVKGHGRVENLFEDADLQMAGYAAALRVLTGYVRIDGIDMTQEAIRPRQKGERGIVDEMIEFAVQVANEHLVPEGMDARVWERMTPSERFYVKMLDLEESGAKKLDNYQNFAKALRVPAYAVMMGSMTPNAARLKAASELKKSEFSGSEFGTSSLRAVIYAIYEITKDVEGDEVMAHLRDLVPAYHQRREELAIMAAYIARKRNKNNPSEAAAARVLNGLIRNERLG